MNLNHQETSGKGKIGRVNENESSTKLRKLQHRHDGRKTMKSGGRGNSKRTDECYRITDRHLTPRSKEDIQPQSHLQRAELDNPNEVQALNPGKPTVRKAESLSGNRKVQEANASSRKTAEIHNRLDRVIPNPKGC